MLFFFFFVFIHNGHADKQTDKQTGRWTYGQTERQIDKETGRHLEGCDREIDRRTHR
jgi:hypothetical protein